ncbi:MULTISPECIES: tRNA (N6-threonylcarbamoyladenosine(37)-N6)-methyltransferase TrmO [Natrialbaceae]|uniref:tRNA (N6-threonylcarbamoyladenosine(37)-N6)-methyltransferase TrmO n=1 Tax=Natrialbaceae TaxID=1644061 RepID=UPI00207C6945|nr:tRNA (N6-threonylcarbamoyladenosine(37)-N6)-methyltransferase TrmO [Natronococcus sp. CG52]
MTASRPELVPVGVARTPYDSPEDAPHQGFAGDAEATIEIVEPYADALDGIDDCYRLTIVYWADRADRDSLGRDGVGAFAKRTPHRPNPLGICTCLLLDRTGLELRVRGLDALDGSPVVDVKPALQAER